MSGSMPSRDAGIWERPLSLEKLVGARGPGLSFGFVNTSRLLSSGIEPGSLPLDTRSGTLCHLMLCVFSLSLETLWSE